MVLAERGFVVRGIGLYERDIRETHDEARRRSLDVEVFEGDVSEAAQVEKFARWLEKAGGRLRAVCNNAAIRPVGTILDTSEQDWDRVFAVNVKGAFLVLRVLLPSMIEAGGGSIVNISSCSSMGAANLVAYSASKSALIAMKISSLGYVGVGSARAKEWERFGPDILGTPLWTEPDDGVYLRIDERAYRIAVHPGERDELRYVGWEVASPTALTDAVEELRGKGVSVERGSGDECRRRHVEGLVVFHDPWGIRHELFYGQRSLMSFRPTRDISGFVTAELGMR